MAAKANSAQRGEILYRRIRRRNVVVGLLRLAVPGFGVVLAGGLIFQIVLANWAEDFALNAIRIERDQVVIDAPRYAGVMSDGTRYEIEAQTARAQINATDIINLETATIVIKQSDGYDMTANAPEAQLRLSDQQVIVNSLMRTRDSNGVRGELTNSVIDWPTQTLKTTGPVRLEFKDGAVIEAQGLVYDAGAGSWDFTGVRYTVPGDNGFGQ